MKLFSNVWILIFLLSFSSAFSLANVQTDFSDNPDELIAIEEITEGKSNISPADLPELISSKKIGKLGNSSFTHFNFSTDNCFLVANILGEEKGIISILFTSKIIYPFHSFL